MKVPLMCSFWASLLKNIVTIYMYSTSTGAGNIPCGAVLPILWRFSVLSFTVHLWRAKHTLQHLTFHHLQTLKDFFVKMLIVTPLLNLGWNTKCFNFIFRGSFILNPGVLRVFVSDMHVTFFEGNFQPKTFSRWVTCL